MMRQLRESTKIIMIIVSIAFVGLMVFEWGMDLSGRAGVVTGGSQLGSVNGAEISVDEYQRQYRFIYEQAQEQVPDGVLSSEDLDRIEQQAWDAVVELQLLYGEASRRGIELTDSELVEFIRFNPPSDMVNLPAVQTDGRFDLQKYHQLLTDPSLSNFWADYEQRLRRTLPIQKLQEQVVAGVTVTDSELLQQFRDRTERARIVYLYLDPDRLVDESSVTITEEDIREYYDAHRDEYRREPSAGIRYVAFEPQVTPADSATVRALADSLAEIARSPDADFAGLAETHSDDRISAGRGGDLGWIQADIMDPAIASVMESMEPGQVSPPIQTPFGWHILKIEDQLTENDIDRYWTRQILLEVRPSPEARDAAREEAQAFALEASSSADAFDDVAGEHGNEVIAPPVFERGVVVPGLGTAPPVSDFVFANDAGSVSGALEWNDSYYVVRVDERYPEGTIALEQVDEAIRIDLLRIRKLDRTREMATDIAETIIQQGLEDAARQFGLEARETEWFTRTNNIPGIGSGTAVAGAAFGLGQGQSAGPIEAPRGLYFIRLVEKQPYDPASFQREKAALRSQARMDKMRSAYLSWYDSLLEQADIEDNRAQLLGI